MENENDILTALNIERFRGLQNVQISPLKRVNLIMGQNNTGKTGILEALLLLSPHGDAYHAANLFRNLGEHLKNRPDEAWNWLMPNGDNKGSVLVRGTMGENNDCGTLLTENDETRPPGFQFSGSSGSQKTYRKGERNRQWQISAVSTHPTEPSQDAIDYNRVILRRKKKEIEKLLRQVDPRVQAIESLQTGENPLLYADIGLKEMIPITQMGQGFNRLLKIYSEVLAAESRMLLIDEIENGLHHSVLSTIWRGLFLAAREVNLQIFATTHSWECVLAADEAARSENQYELSLIRLDRVNGKVKATVIERGALDTAKELHWEMR